MNYYNLVTSFPSLHPGIQGHLFFWQEILPRDVFELQSWDANVKDLRVTEGHIPAIKQTTEQAGVQVYPEYFQGANIFPTSQRDRALSTMRGYLQEDDLQFESLEEAHDAVLALVGRALAGRT